MTMKMRPTGVPWGVHYVSSMFGDSTVRCGLPDGRWVRAVCEPYRSETLRERLTVAWWVFTGRAHAVVWPKPGDIERALDEPGKVRT